MAGRIGRRGTRAILVAAAALLAAAVLWFVIATDPSDPPPDAEIGVDLPAGSEGG